MTMSALNSALNASGYPFKHHGWAKAPAGSYGVFAEYGSRQAFADGHCQEQVLTVSVDLFTRDDTSTPKTTIQTIFDGLGVPWFLNSVQYEEDTGYIHYEWIVEVNEAVYSG